MGVILSASRTGIPAARFMATSHSFWVDSRISNCERLLRAYGVEETPCIVVNGKYLINMRALHSSTELIQLVDWLVGRESH